MNIAVVSPHTNKTGVTSLAILTALELGKKSKKVCIVHTSCASNCIDKYLGLGDVLKDDKTNNPSRLVKMINEGDVKPEEIHDYCKVVNENVEVFTASSKLQEDELYGVLEFISQSKAFDYVMIDVDSPGVQSRINNRVMELCDCALVVLNQSAVELEVFKESNNKIMRYLGNTPLTVVINKYCDIAASIKETAALLGVKKPNNWLTVRFNAWVQWACNNGRMTELSECISDSEDMRVVDLAADLRSILNMILKIKVATRKERVDSIKNR